MGARPTHTATAATGKDKADWLAVLDVLLRQIENWATSQRWLVSRLPKRIEEDGPFGPYDVDVLSVHCGQGVVCIEPRGRFIIGADGRVDIYAFPSMHRHAFAQARQVDRAYGFGR